MKLKPTIENAIDCKNICGVNNKNIKVIEEIYNVEIGINGSNINVSTDEYAIVNKITKLFEILLEVSKLKLSIKYRDIIYISALIEEEKEDLYIDFITNRKPICYTYNNKPIFAKTIKQEEYIKTINKKELIFSIGAAGTGKTYLAVSYAVSLLKKGNIEKIILTRPAVEAGESLGFLPGDLKEKIDPYLRPLYDALYDMLGIEQTQSLIEKQIIEIAPLAYMRGRTLENAFIILDEAQNATIDQLKMFLTRLGFNSKMLVTGDVSQIDLPNTRQSGLKVSANLLKDLPEVGYIVFEKKDVVRHPLVAKIIDKFEKIENK